MHQERHVFLSSRSWRRLALTRAELPLSIIGRREGDRLLYAGKARTGYTLDAARRVRERLDPLIIRKSPLTAPIVKPKATWVISEVLAEIEFSSVTDRGVLREAVFKGLREDFAPVPVEPPAASPVRKPNAPQANRKASHGVPPENILQLLPDAISPSKDELVRYWERVADEALVHVGTSPFSWCATPAAPPSIIRANCQAFLPPYMN
jgi:bifunctional non-homologous end joining protein LigD